MKNSYISPQLCFFHFAEESIVCTSTKVTSLNSNVFKDYDYGSNGSARVKEASTSNVWNDDWSQK